MSGHLNMLRDESGFSLIEVVVAALVLVIGAIGVFGALQAVGKAGAQERHRSQSYQIAQEDQARLRSLKVTDLLNLDQTRTVVQDGDSYTVTSKSRFTTDSTGTQSCDTGVAAADYLNVTSTITWPSMGTRPAVVIESVIAPPNGSFAADRGALAVAVRNSQSNGIAGINLAGSGVGSFSGTTGSNGCSIFANLPEGNYTLTPSASGYVDKDGNAASSVPVSVVSQSTNSVALQLDRPGTISATFTTRNGSTAVPGTLVPSRADSVMVFNTGMTAAKNFGTIGTRISPRLATPLFPFASPDTVYAGACTGNNPNPTGGTPPASVAPAIASVTVPPNGTVAAPIVLPALNLTVRAGSAPGTSTQGALVTNAKVTVTDKNCSVGGVPIKRTLAAGGTNATPSGKLPNADRGVPWSNYDICVSSSTLNKRFTTTNLAIKSATNPTDLTIYLGSTGAVAGTCP